MKSVPMSPDVPVHHREPLEEGPAPGVDAVAQTVVTLLRVPVALVSLVDAGQHRLVAWPGLDDRERARALQLCERIVTTGVPTVVPDVLADERFHDTPRDPRLRACAGIPLRSAEGAVLGTLCAMDERPRPFDPDALALLEALAHHVVTLLEPQGVARPERTTPRRRRTEHSSLLDLVPACIAYFDTNLVCRFANAAHRERYGQEPSALVGLRAPEMLGTETYARVAERMAAAARGEPQSLELESTHPDGHTIAERIHFVPDLDDERVLGFLAHAEDITRKVALRRERIAHAEHLAALLAALPGRYFHASRDERILAVHGGSGDPAFVALETVRAKRTMLEMFETPGMEHVGKAYMDAVQEAELTGLTQLIEYTQPLPGKADREREARIRIVPGTGDRVVLVLDITARKRSERHARAHDALLRTVLDASPVAVLVTDDTHGLVTANPATAHIFGGNVGELRAGSLRDWRFTDEGGAPFVPDGRSDMLPVRDWSKRSPLVVRAETPTRAVRWLQVGCAAVPSTPGRTVVTVADVTPLVTARTMAVERDARFRAVVANALEAILIVDERGHIVEGNTAAEQLFGRPSAELVGKRFCELLPDFRHGGQKACTGDVANQLGVGTHRDVIARRADGSSFPAEMTAITFEDEGRPFFATTMRDLTDRRRTEQAITENELRVRKAVAYELHDGVNQTLVGASMLAEALAHDLGAPLKTKARRLQELVAKALDQSAALSRTLSAVELTKETLVDALQGLVNNAARTHPLDFELSAAPGLPETSPAHRTQAFLVAQEAVSNAARHSGGHRVVVSLQQDVGGYVLSVADDGRRGTLENREGSLGLRSMHYRARLIGGTLEIRTTATGTTVVLRWPLEPEGAATST